MSDRTAHEAPSATSTIVALRQPEVSLVQHHRGELQAIAAARQTQCQHVYAKHNRTHDQYSQVAGRNNAFEASSLVPSWAVDPTHLTRNLCLCFTRFRYTHRKSHRVAASSIAATFTARLSYRNSSNALNDDPWLPLIFPVHCVAVPSVVHTIVAIEQPAQCRLASYCNPRVPNEQSALTRSGQPPSFSSQLHNNMQPLLNFCPGGAPLLCLWQGNVNAMVVAFFVGIQVVDFLDQDLLGMPPLDEDFLGGGCLGGGNPGGGDPGRNPLFRRTSTTWTTRNTTQSTRCGWARVGYG